MRADKKKLMAFALAIQAACEAVPKPELEGAPQRTMNGALKDIGIAIINMKIVGKP